MIYVANDRGSKELLPALLRAGVPAELREMPSSDFCFTGSGPGEETISIGIELKKINELTVYKRTRLAKQAPRMAQFFDRSYLIVEGEWSANSDGKMVWFKNGRWVATCIPGGTDFHYAFIDNHLTSLTEFTGMQVKRTAHNRETVRAIVDAYKWWQKPYEQHAMDLGYDVSLLPPSRKVEGYNASVTLLTKWLEDIDGVGPGTALLLARRWDTPKQMVLADTSEWIMKKVIGKKRAASIREQLWGKDIFVFGSNLAGIHGKGAALAARKEHGAVLGEGIGPQGDSYAIPTKDEKLAPLPLSVIGRYVVEFLAYAKERPHRKFIVTSVGCGLAGYTKEEIAPMFHDYTSNIVFFDAEFQVASQVLSKVGHNA